MRDIIKKILRETDELDWIRSISDKFQVEPETIYYARPVLSEQDTRRFVEMLGPELSSGVRNRIIDEAMELSFLSFDQDLKILGWCTSTTITDYITDHGLHHYNLVDIRTLLW